MLTPRNIHFVVLGLILGASAAYIFAFYQVESVMPAQAESAATNGLPANHPDADGLPANHPEVNDEQMLDLLKKTVEEKPDQPEVISRYANVLLGKGRYDEAVKWYGKVVELQPDNLDARTMRGVAYWQMNRVDEAATDLQAVLKRDPGHIKSLIGMFLVSLYKHDVPTAEKYLAKVQAIDPSSTVLPELKEKLDEERSKAAK
jgi:tetratricopeptide (TPR) repeat protein